MIKLFRWMFWLASTLLGLVVFTAVLAYYFAARSLPEYDGEFTVSGISAPVEIVRDNSDVPHIFGASDADSFYALGFVHAQDRFWQMIVARRTAQGRLSEVFGRRTLPADVLMRRLDIYNLSVASVDALDEDTLTLLEAYSAGVNAWLAEVNDGARGRGAPEMWLFNQPVAPWQPADSIALMKVFALKQSSQIYDEVLRANVSKLVEPDRIRDILPEDSTNSGGDPKRFTELVQDMPSRLPGIPTEPDPLYPVRPAGEAGSANAWAAGPERSTTGSTLLANDLHSTLTAPANWYLARLELENGGVIGATIPGIPAVLSGRSADIGWAITASTADDLDLYLEEVNPENSAQYRGTDGWKNFETRDSIVVIEDQPAVTLKLLWTENGPILPPEQFNLDTIRTPGHVLSANWTGLSDQDTTLEAAIGIMRARSVEGAISAARPQIAPALNLMIADRNNIGLKVIGKLPSRSRSSDSEGRMPSYGYKPENRWDGFQSYSRNYSLLDPEEGILGNTNNRTTDRSYPSNMTFDWGDNQRIHRWERLMSMRGVHTRESFIEAQLDTVSYSARTLLPLVGANLWFTGEPAPDGTPQRRRQQALELLANWNGEMNEHLPEPLIYAAWMRELQDRLIRDNLGPLADSFTHIDPVFIERVFRDVDGAGVWCDIIQSEPLETCTDIARAALDDALIWIAEHQGTAVEALRWGDAHQAVHTHPVLGQSPILKWVANITQSTSGGDNTLMRGLTSGIGALPFENVEAATYRGVYDFADPDSSVFVVSTGQSGHPLSRYYDDQGERWRQGEYIPMSLDPTLARAAATGVTHLVPRR
ncbi:penicillin acylase family protein [Marivivens donghaensis]|uniref:Penicillin acylase family protein n=1 Tax=Marivivens donghaensis TaxID=1699413 RepID=A0ABX0VY74_9RHOB|nr:penicillin acylase family protein [Marivivens donghaensis]NIY72941.1 penicillin acylase family protein [Marivivens donghaensis]